MQFQHHNPEQNAPPPGVQVQTPLGKMRRKQLLYLAEAFGVEGVDGSLPKDLIMPILVSAEARGLFREPPQKPWLLARVEYPSNPERWPPVPQSEPVKVFTPQPVESSPVTETVERPRTLEEMSFSEIREKGKEAGINTFQMKKEAIIKELREPNGPVDHDVS